MSIELALVLPTEAAKLPEVGSTLLQQAERLQNRATSIKAQMMLLQDDIDLFLVEIRELWSDEERKGTLL